MYGALLVMCLIALSGCASSNKVNFIKMTPTDVGKDLKLLRSQPYAVALEVEGKVRFAFAQCKDEVNGGFCLDLFPSEGTRVKLESDRFIEVDPSTGIAKTTYKPDAITYVMSCLIKDDGTEVCDTSKDNPTTQEVKTQEGRLAMIKDGRVQIYKKSFKSTAEFIGVKQQKHLLLSFTGARERTYSLIIGDKTLIDEGEKLFRFPNLIVDGHTYKIPDISMKKVNEELCFMRPLQ